MCSSSVSVLSWISFNLVVIFSTTRYYCSESGSSGHSTSLLISVLIYSNTSVVSFGCRIARSRIGNSRNTRTRNTRRPEQEIPNCQTCGSFLKEKKFRAYQKFFFISNTRAVLSRIPFICCIYQTSLAFLKYFTYLKIPYIPV